MLTEAEQWERMEQVECEEPPEGVLVVSGRVWADLIPAVCPECGRVVVADEVRRLRGGDGRRWYFTMHGGELHELAVRGRAREKRRDKRTR